MPIFTICVTNKKYTMKPCAIIPAHTLNNAIALAKDMTNTGILDFLPNDVNLSARPASRIELKRYNLFLKTKIGNSKTGQTYSRDRNPQKMHLIFNENLWRDDHIHPNKVKARRPKKW